MPDPPFGDPYPLRLTGLPLPHFPPSVPPTLTDWMASHRPPNFTHLPHLPRLTDWGAKGGGLATYGQGGLPHLPDPLPSFPTPPFFTRPPPQLTRPPFLGGEGEKPLEKAVPGRFLPLLPHLPDLSLITEGKRKKGGG